MKKHLITMCIIMSSIGINNHASAKTVQCDIRTPYNIFVTEHADANGGGYVYHKVKQVIILSDPTIPVTNFKDHEWMDVRKNIKWNKSSKSLAPKEELVGVSGDGWTRPLVKQGQETTCIVFDGDKSFREIDIVETR